MADDAQGRAFDAVGELTSTQRVEAARATLAMRAVSIAGAGSTAAKAPAPGDELLRLYNRWRSAEVRQYEDHLRFVEATRTLRGALAALEEIEEAHERRAAKAATKAAKSLAKSAATPKERRYTLGVAYKADTPDPFRGQDGRRDFASAPVLEDAAWRFLKNGAKVGLHHADGTDGAGTVVESYVYRGPDWKLNGAVVKAGDWLVGIKWDKTAWAAIKAGRVTGLSLQGRASRRRPDPATVRQLVGGAR